MHALHAGVDALMRRLGRDVLMAHFQKLEAGQIEEKAPDDYVTIADKESEARLIEGLTALLPGSHVVGEEGVAADASLILRATEGTAWIVDPLDGTGNFAAGRTPFAMMVALAEGGVVQAGWILDPVGGRMCHAVLGGGAYIDGTRITARPTGGTQPIGALATRYLPDDVRASVMARSEGHISIADIPHCAGEQYPRLVLGTNDLALFWRAMPWDHAPGALFLEEAGGRIARIDGRPYRLGDDRPGLLAAASPRLWDEAAERLFG
ncbi:MAG: inositol monophosphatase family protein [Sphingomonas oligoaromativorans]